MIFDNDGLTLDTESVWTRAEVALFAGYGREFTHEHKLALVGCAGAVAEAKLAAMLECANHEGPGLLRELHSLLADELARGCSPMPGARELLAELARAGVPVALCSNSPRRFVDLALDGAGMADVFPHSIAGDEVPRGKPAPDPYLAAAAKLGVPPAACVALEDSPVGAASARSAGMRVLGIPSVPGVDLRDAVDGLFESLADDALRAALGITTAFGDATTPGSGSGPGDDAGSGESRAGDGRWLPGQPDDVIDSVTRSSLPG